MVLMCHNSKGIWQKVKKRFKKCKILWQLVVEKEKKSIVDKYFAPRNTKRAQPFMRSVLAGKKNYLKSRYDSWKILL